MFSKMGGPLGAAAMRAVLEPVVTSGGWDLASESLCRQFAGACYVLCDTFHACHVCCAGASSHLGSEPSDLNYRCWCGQLGLPAWTACWHQTLELPAAVMQLLCLSLRAICCFPTVVILRDKVEQDRFVVR